jgi:hypothetical protein
MAGVNLSQSMTAPEGRLKKSASMSFGFPISIVLFVLTLLGWGGLRWYMSSLDGKIARLDVEIAANSAEFHSERVERVENFDDRLSLLNVDPAESIDPESIFLKLESVMVPQVVLTEYEYNGGEKQVTVSGKTDNFRYVAEQIISLKSDPMFSQVVVSAISRDKDGKITFTLVSQFLN